MDSIEGNKERNDKKYDCSGCNKPDVPIHSLPDEILCIIFTMNTYKTRSANRQPNHDPLSTTLRTSCVCWRWRHVALNHSILWARLIDYERHPKDRIEELLKRSNNCPLQVGGRTMFEPIHLDGSRSIAIMKSIFEHTDRLESFRLHIRFKPWEFLSQTLLRKPAPMLRAISLDTQCPFPTGCVALEPLFANDAPNLREMQLQRCLVDFTSPTLVNLTILSVFDVLSPAPLINRGQPSNPIKVAPTAEGWLRILQNIPSLQFLTLANAISASATNPHTEHTRPFVTLPHLALLTVSAFLKQGMEFIPQLVIPQSCGLRFRLSKSRSSLEDGTQLLNTLSHQLIGWPENPLHRYLQAKILSGDRIHYGNSKRVGHIWNISEADLLREHRQSSDDPLVWLILTFDHLDDTLYFFNSLLRLYAVTLPATTALDLWIDQEFSDLALTRILSPTNISLDSLNSLQVLNLVDQSPTYILPLLQHLSRSEQPLLPRLKILCLTGASFSTTPPSIKALVSHFVSWRSQVGHSLANLHLIECKVWDGDLDSLREISDLQVSKGPMDSLPVET